VKLEGESKEYQKEIERNCLKGIKESIERRKLQRKGLESQHYEGEYGKSYME